MAIFASRYVRALAEVVAAKKLDASAVQQQLQNFSEVLSSSPALQETFLNPAISMKQKLGILDVLMGKIGAHHEVRNFIAVILDHQRLSSLENILAEYAQLADENSGISEAEITSARPLNEEDRVSLEKQVAVLAGGPVRAFYKEDATLLGGAIVRIGSTVYDGSIKAQLQQLKKRLINA